MFAAYVEMRYDPSIDSIRVKGALVTLLYSRCFSGDLRLTGDATPNWPRLGQGLME